jgi:hypothetical protein|tara:strand:+ start:113 stop:463 length:351 start_codon:yes stop_codon:yes gene_type:complete
MGSRYNRTDNQELSDLDYKKVYKDKFNNNRRQFIKKIATININYPSFEEMLDLDFENYIWTVGDRYYKLSTAFYGSPNYWWVIAWFNKKPTESHIKVGDVIRIPTSLGSALTAMGY